MRETSALADGRRFEGFVPRVRSDAVVRQYDTEAVAWSPIGPGPFHLDPVAAIVFQLLNGQVSVAELIDDVTEVLGIPRVIARNQLGRTLLLLDQASLLATSSEVAHPAELEFFSQPPNP